MTLHKCHHKAGLYRESVSLRTRMRRYIPPSGVHFLVGARGYLQCRPDNRGADKLGPRYRTDRLTREVDGLHGRVAGHRLVEAVNKAEEGRLVDAAAEQFGAYARTNPRARSLGRLCGITTALGNRDISPIGVAIGSICAEDSWSELAGVVGSAFELARRESWALPPWLEGGCAGA